MIGYHLTTKENAKQIELTGIMIPGSFCFGEFQALFFSLSESFDWIERDVILGNQDGWIVKFIVPDLPVRVDPEAHIYGQWRYIQPQGSIEVEVLGVDPCPVIPLPWEEELLC